jgi:hypothetical protein
MKPGRVAEDQVANPEACTTQGRCLLAVIRRTPRAASEALGGVEVSCHSQWVRALSDESRGGLEGGRHVATKDKGGSKSRKKTPTKTLKQKRQTKKAKQAGGTAK